MFTSLREVLQDKDKSALRLFLAIFAWFVGYNAIEAFFSLYTVNHLKLAESDASRLLGHLSILFVLSAFGAGFIGSRLGRRVTISAGLIVLGSMIASIYLLPAETLITQLVTLPVLGTVRVVSLFLMGSGFAWALININSLPMVVDMVENARTGTFTGLYYLFSTLAAIAGPNINGWIVELSGRDYSVVMLVAPFFMLIALLLMWGVRRGEAQLAA